MGSLFCEDNDVRGNRSLVRRSEEETRRLNIALVTARVHTHQANVLVVPDKGHRRNSRDRGHWLCYFEWVSLLVIAFSIYCPDHVRGEMRALLRIY
jgi:hypothetical protein